MGRVGLSRGTWARVKGCARARERGRADKRETCVTVSNRALLSGTVSYEGNFRALASQALAGVCMPQPLTAGKEGRAWVPVPLCNLSPIRTDDEFGWLPVGKKALTFTTQLGSSSLHPFSNLDLLPLGESLPAKSLPTPLLLFESVASFQSPSNCRNKQNSLALPTLCGFLIPSRSPLHHPAPAA